MLPTPSLAARRRRRPRTSRAALLAVVPVLALAVGLGPVATGPASSAPAPASSAVAQAATSSAASASSAVPAASAAPRKRIRFKTASFNILGSHHTTGPGGYANGKKRARLAVKFLKRERTSVLGMSEAERNQMRIITGPGGFRSFPKWKKSSDIETAQSVVWKPQKWRFVRGTRFVIPFNYGNSREQPIVLLRHRASGRLVWVVSVHLQTGTSKQAVRERETGMQRMIKRVRELRPTGHPVLLSGDMNDRKRVFCQVLRNTSLTSASGGSWRKRRCRPPAGARIDWIFGAKRFAFSDFRYADSRRIDKITDHTVPVATVRY